MTQPQPEEHLGLVGQFVKTKYLRWYPAGTHPEETEEWYNACVGLIIACRKFDSTRGAKFSTYAYYWMSSTCKAAYIAERRHRIRIQRYKDSRPKQYTIPQEIYERAEQIEWIKAKLKLLPKHLREVVRLRLAGYSNSRIAHRLNISFHTVSDRHSMAVRMLKNLDRI